MAAVLLTSKAHAVLSRTFIDRGAPWKGVVVLHSADAWRLLCSRYRGDLAVSEWGVDGPQIQ